jgi:uncharacterized protein
MQDTTRTEIEAAMFRRLLQQLDERKNVQNIELMNPAGFCRNHLATWHVDFVSQHGIAIELDEARESVHVMPNAEWKRLHQKEASTEPLDAFDSRAHSGDSDA